MVLLLDGGSTSIREFLPEQAPPISTALEKLWTSAYSITCPSAVKAWQSSFLKAGSDIITTNTYQIPVAALSPEIDVANLQRTAVRLAVETVSEQGKGSIALSLGTRNACFGKGDYSTEAKATADEYAIFHRNRITEYRTALGDLWNEIEYLAFETLSSYEEAQAILRVLSDESISPLLKSKKSWITFSCGDASIERMDIILTKLLKLPEIDMLWGIGFNCVGIDIANELGNLLSEKLSSSDLVLVMYPDAGRWRDKTIAQFTYDALRADQMDVKNWAEAMLGIAQQNGGRIVVGGCCNTDSRFISALSALLSQERDAHSKQ